MPSSASYAKPSGSDATAFRPAISCFACIPALRRARCASSRRRYEAKLTRCSTGAADDQTVAHCPHSFLPLCDQPLDGLQLPLHTHLFGVCDRSTGNAWCPVWQLAGGAPHLALPPMVQGRPRSRSRHSLRAPSTYLKEMLTSRTPTHPGKLRYTFAVLPRFDS